MYSKKRKYLFTGLVISIVSYCTYIVSCLLWLYFASTIDNGNLDKGTYATIFLVIIFLILFCVFALTFSSLSMRSCKAQPGNVYENQAFVVTTFVCNCIIAIFSLTIIFWVFNYICIAIAISLFISAGCIFIDYINRNKLMEKENEKQND